MNDLVIRLCNLLHNNYLNQGYNQQCDFVVEPGRKYLKVIHVSNSSKSVHAFIDKENGDVYKAASWKSPAKGVRYNLIKDIVHLEELSVSDYPMWCGSYLYR